MTLLAVAYLGGVLTILSPCILPVLPFVFARAQQPFVRSTLPMLAGMAMTFALVATLASVGGGWVVQANEYGRYAALALLAVSGVTLLSPRLAGALTQPVVALANRLMKSTGGTSQAPTSGAALLVGIATGLLWAPCAGPILGLVLTGAALHGANAKTTLLLVAYAAGAATSLAVALLIGGRVFTAMKQSLGAGEWVRRGLGAAVLCGVAAIGLGADTGLLARFSNAGTARFEQALLDTFPAHAKPPSTRTAARVRDGIMRVAADARPAFRSGLPVEGSLPSLDGAVGWLNSPPLTSEQLRGRVVLVDFWTYSCINCIRTIPYLRAWAEKYKDQGLTVIGVHTPEFAFERNAGNIRKAIDGFRIGYPVAVDSDFKIWRAFDNHYWPAIYFVDAKGRIRYHQFGEGDYDKAEKVIQDLLAEAGAAKAATPAVTPDATGAQAAPDLDNVRSAETYIGYQQASNFASPEGLTSDVARNYTIGAPRLNRWGLDGNWTVGAEQATLNRANGGITYRFRARDLHLVLGAGADGKPVRFQVKVDGKAPAESHGADIDAAGNGTVTQTRLYQLVRQSGEVAERTFEIRFLDPGVQAFVFTFG
ncbi:cytochrome c biogenesis protein DipZ [Cupriavidus sp. 2TAF22]|uniref:cytochrome c biogenesis protein DipZ n=1 Tax=unclassified Cupriavidus TaxID=2640874 RepID=UPI003F8E389F